MKWFWIRRKHKYCPHCPVEAAVVEDINHPLALLSDLQAMAEVGAIERVKAENVTIGAPLLDPLLGK